MTFSNIHNVRFGLWGSPCSYYISTRLLELLSYFANEAHCIKQILVELRVLKFNILVTLFQTVFSEVFYLQSWGTSILQRQGLIFFCILIATVYYKGCCFDLVFVELEDGSKVFAPRTQNRTLEKIPWCKFFRILKNFGYKEVFLTGCIATS